MSRLMLDEVQGTEIEQALEDCIRIILLSRLNEAYGLIGCRLMKCCAGEIWNMCRN